MPVELKPVRRGGTSKTRLDFRGGPRAETIPDRGPWTFGCLLNLLLEASGDQTRLIWFLFSKLFS